MAWITAETVFDHDRLGLPIVGIAAKLAKHDSGEHQHKMGQLLFTESGCIRITLSQRLCMLPPTRVAWIPAHTRHRAEMKAVVGYRSIYLDTTRIKSLPSEVVVMEANPLLRALLERIALSCFDTNWQQGAAANLFAVALDEIHAAQREPMTLRLPTDRRVAACTGDSLLPSLTVFASNAGASEKTISRIFMQETGLSYQQWRQQWRFLKAIELLSERGTLSRVADELGFASDSAFVFFFKQMSGVTPRTYFPVAMMSERLVRENKKESLTAIPLPR